jgi:hypothetical protein
VIRRSLSLIEVVVSMAVLAVLMVGAMSLLLSTQSAAMATAATFHITEEGRKAVSEIRRELRQSGWEKALVSTTDANLGNMVPNPVPGDFNTPAGQLGTPNLPGPFPNDFKVLRFRKRIAFAEGPDPSLAANRELWDWSNDDPNDAATLPDPTIPYYIVYQAIPDGVYRGVPGGPVPRFKLVRSYGPLNAEVPQGLVVHNLEDVFFKREDFDTVLVQLDFLIPNPAGQGADPPQPIRRRIMERIQVMNSSGKE